MYEVMFVLSFICNVYMIMKYEEFKMYHRQSIRDANFWLEAYDKEKNRQQINENIQ